MKKLILALTIMCLLAGCTKETISQPEDIATKVFIQVDVVNNDGTVTSSLISILD